MMLRGLCIAIVLAFALAAWSASEHKAPNADLPLIQADYRLCVIILIAAMLVWACDYLPMPYPLRMIVRVLIILVGALLIAQRAGLV